MTRIINAIFAIDFQVELYYPVTRHKTALVLMSMFNDKISSELVIKKF